VFVKIHDKKAKLHFSGDRWPASGRVGGKSGNSRSEPVRPGIEFLGGPGSDKHSIGCQHEKNRAGKLLAMCWAMSSCIIGALFLTFGVTTPLGYRGQESQDGSLSVCRKRQPQRAADGVLSQFSSDRLACGSIFDKKSFPSSELDFSLVDS